MPRILIIHSGLSGISNACLELARRLESYGHDVWMSSMQDDKTKITANGYNYLAVQPIRWEYASDQRKSKRAEYYDILQSELRFNEFENSLFAHNIDLVLIDQELHEYILYLTSSDHRFVLLSQWFTIWQDAYNLPPSSTSIPSSSLAIKAAWILSNIKGRIKTILHQVKTKQVNRRNFILHLADTFGFDKAGFIQYQFPLPFSYQSLPVLLMTHPDLEFSPTKQEYHHYIYPMVKADRVEEATEAFTQDFEQILSSIQGSNQKLIVVTRSSMQQSDVGIIHQLIKVLQQLPDTICVVSAGKFYDQLLTYHQVDNIYVYAHIPQLTVLKHADLSINHGGIHTINECIHFKVPMLVLSGGRFDQNGCSARVQHHGCGVSINGKVSNQSLSDIIADLLAHPKYQDSIQSLNNSYLKAIDDHVLEMTLDWTDL